MKPTLGAAAAAIILLLLSPLMQGPGQLSAQQVQIPRIEAMPDFPQPYLMRDWKRVALDYDSLVYDLGLEGTYRPHTSLYSGTINYPEHGSFHQQTYVGQPLDRNEAINSMAGVVGASLCGIDKRSSMGQNWVLMLEEFFNRANGEDLYLNNAGARTGNDWWYETIPNVLFYQLYSLYPQEGHFEEQFLTVADRWLEAVVAMGGQAAPWEAPYMYYRSFDFQDMEPLASGVPEPGAAGALAWIFYQAYGESGLEKYRVGAELCLEYFNDLTENPVYELQFLYGVVAAARMNAELGTAYELEKMMNWCFDVGPLRKWAHTTGWGVTVGKWNGMDVCGLRGAISVPENTDFGDYAFALNSFSQAGILAPVARYDDRYARALGKYILNAANSARLFYSAFLPDENQDGATWAQEYDPRSSIAYEALRRYQDGKSPFATGDALKGGWAPTNHSLYSSSGVGYLGAILDTTNIEGILLTDLLVTDFFHDAAYPSYLVYNPHAISHSVELELGQELTDVYNAVSNQLVLSGASGLQTLDLSGDQAAVWVLIPAGSELVPDGNLTRCNGRVIDYIPESPLAPPLRLKALAAEDSVITTQASGVSIHCTASTSASGGVSYLWWQSGESPVSGGPVYTWTSPHIEGDYWIACRISDASGDALEDSVKIRVQEFINQEPRIEAIIPTEARTEPGGQNSLLCRASDPNGETLSFSWEADNGSFASQGDSTSVWTAPQAEGEYVVRCLVADGYQGTATDSIVLRVQDPASYVPGSLIAHYPFNYDVEDYSGYDNHGSKKDLTFIKVRDAAYLFNGLSSVVEVPSSSILNCNEAITVSFWMMPTRLYTRETYPISHGLWHERWKVSVSNGLVRWTLRTVDQGQVSISDLDSRTPVALDSLIHITASYDGSYSDLFINAGFEGFLRQSGSIEDTEIAMTIGQASPTATGNNFKGVLDEFRIYDYALSHADIREAYQRDLLVMNGSRPATGDGLQVYPNPSGEQQQVLIAYHLDAPASVQVRLYDMLCREVRQLYAGHCDSGPQRLSWDGRDQQGHSVPPGIYLCRVFAGEREYSSRIMRN